MDIWDLKEFKQFAQNRLAEIRKLVDFRKWRYCPSEENPSDIPTKGMKLSRLMKNSEWWKGPKFLSIKNKRVLVS